MTSEYKAVSFDFLDNSYDDSHHVNNQRRKGRGIWSIITLQRIVVASILFISLGSLSHLLRHRLVLSPKQKFVSLPSGAKFTYRFNRPTSTDTDYDHPLNSTFGFQKIYILSMKHRTDKRAEALLLASEYGLDIEFVDGVEGRKLLPDEDHIVAGIHGTAEGHSRCWQKAIEDKVSTALIFEDDFDFDVRIRAQLKALQDPLETLLMLKSNKDQIPIRTVSDPWHSSKWDLLWLGNQMERSWPAEEIQPYLSYQDSTTVPPKDEYLFVNQILKDYGFEKEREQGATSGQVRILQEVKFTFGFHGYAITNLGAKKLLYAYTHKGVIDHIDTLTHILANEKKLRAYSLIPGIFSQLHSPMGKESDSDRQHTHVRLSGEEGISPGIQKSAKKSLREKINSHTEE